ncbi:O-acyltransferase WSD1-like [Iris pallida]|uniref:O-acyltransferase WSD1-like n=1 Tax=Iris pallida TaxID=29817 RepID=A0AAX6IDD8_IRIPA|nr:O-acyltransferase WSD1-like [Iris pallida]
MKELVGMGLEEQESCGTRGRRALTINTTPKKEEEDEEVERLTEPLSPAARLFHQPSFNCHIVSIMGMSKRIDVDTVKAGLEETLVRHPRFSSVLVSDGSGDGKERWLRTKVVIDNHIVAPNLEVDTCAASSPDELVEHTYPPSPPPPSPSPGPLGLPHPHLRPPRPRPSRCSASTTPSATASPSSPSSSRAPARPPTRPPSRPSPSLGDVRRHGAAAAAVDFFPRS